MKPINLQLKLSAVRCIEEIDKADCKEEARHREFIANLPTRHKSTPNNFKEPRSETRRPRMKLKYVPQRKQMTEVYELIKRDLRRAQFDFFLMG
jgi:hypothetical protein